MGTARVLIDSAQAHRHKPTLHRQEPGVHTLAPAPRAEETSSPVTVSVSGPIIRAPMGIACSGAPEPAAPQTPRSRPPGGAEGAPGLHSPGRSAGSRERFRLRADPEAAPPPGPAPAPAPPAPRGPAFRAPRRPRSPAHLALADAEDAAAATQAHAGAAGLRGRAAEGEGAARGPQLLHRGAH